MIKQNLNHGWEFRFCGETAYVDLPHDYSILQDRRPDCPSLADGGYFPGGAADYTKMLRAQEEWLGKDVYLEFEGVYMNATVRVNHHIVAFQPYGYTSFCCNITPYLKIGKDNLISVNVNNGAQPNSRWYSGSGIYRPVWLMIGQSPYIKPYGIYVTTPVIAEEYAEITVETALSCGEGATVRTAVIDASGHERASSDSGTLRLDGPVLWSVENPYLYTLRSKVFKNGVMTDSAETKFGVRSISVDAANGFMLNGKPMKLKGGCVHHDCGILGAAAFDRAEERKVELLKQSGFNAVRCAHNPPSPAFLNACDRLGMLVMDEAFDMWREKKQPHDYHLHFDDWWQRDLAAMILRDRSHPSVVIWSTGNEILERDGRSGGNALARELADFVRQLDPTRPVANGLCELWDSHFSEGLADPWAELTKDFAAPLDIVGYNYMPYRYEKDGKLFPGRVIAGTETFAKDAFDYWEATEKHPHVIGDFVWTAWDYLGEAGIGRVLRGDDKGHGGAYPWHQAWCGDIDICGHKRPQSYYRDFVWGIGREPFIAVHRPEFFGVKTELYHWAWPDVTDRWDWPGFEGKPVEIEVYSGGDETELLLNGVSLGRNKTERYTAGFETVYTPGELTAVVYKNGRETYRTKLATAGEPASVSLKVDRRILTAFDDLAFVTAEITDANGNIVRRADDKLSFSVSGAGVLQAVGNNDPCSEESYAGTERKAHEGRAVAVVRAKEVGDITLHVTAEGLPAAQLRIISGN
jgi:beta-galactosidase